MFGGLFRKKSSKSGDKFEIEEDPDDETDSGLLNSLKLHLSRLIAYAESADIKLQREVAEKLANEAVKPERQKQIVEYGGLRLLIPLTKSVDVEVQRLAAHALANLSVNADNQVLMAQEGGIEMLIGLLDNDHELIQRQSAKALANLGVNTDNKRAIALKGGIPKLVRLAGAMQLTVKIEAIAALANLAVNDANELEIVQYSGLVPIVGGMAEAVGMLYRNNGYHGDVRDYANYEELAAQCARALRNLSVNAQNKAAIIRLDAIVHLRALTELSNERISQQARRALRNLDYEAGAKK
jgi:hypothetical protein